MNKELDLIDMNKELDLIDIRTEFDICSIALIRFAHLCDVI